MTLCRNESVLQKTDPLTCCCVVRFRCLIRWCIGQAGVGTRQDAVTARGPGGLATETRGYRGECAHQKLQILARFKIVRCFEGLPPDNCKLAS
jgi:hypothetical protein